MHNFSLKGTQYEGNVPEDGTGADNGIANKFQKGNNDTTEYKVREAMDKENLFDRSGSKNKDSEKPIEENSEVGNEEKKDEEVNKEKVKEKYNGLNKDEFEKFHFGEKPNSSKSPSDNGKDSGEKEPTDEGKKIEYKFSFPEDVELDCDTMDKFQELANKDKLSNDQAQKYVDLVSNMVLKDVEKNKQLISERINSWVKETKEDPEIGGSKLKETIKVANKAIDKFGGNELRKFLDLTGLGNNKEFIKTFYKVGKSISEDNIITSNVREIPPKDKAKDTVNEWGQVKLSFPSMNRK